MSFSRLLAQKQVGNGLLRKIAGKGFSLNRRDRLARLRRVQCRALRIQSKWHRGYDDVTSRSKPLPTQPAVRRLKLNHGIEH